MGSIVNRQYVTAGFGVSPRTSGAFSAPTSGNALHVVITMSDFTSKSAFTLTDDQSNTYTLDGTMVDNFAATRAFIFSCKNITNAPVTMTFSWSGGGSAGVAFAVIQSNGWTTGSPSAAVTTTAYSTDSTSSYTADANDIFIGAFYGSTGPWTPVGGVTVDAMDFAEASVYNGDLGAAGSKSLGMTWTGSAWWAQMGIRYPTSGGGGSILSGGFTVRFM